MTNFKIKLKEYQEIVNKYLENEVKDESCYEKRLNEAAKYSLMAGRKKIKTDLCIRNL